jgi:CHAT domain-containing protein/predicted negative regulator of RcsB-dependent stress response
MAGGRFVGLYVQDKEIVIMWNKKNGLRCVLAIGLVATLSVAFSAHAQRFSTGSSRLEEILRDAESAAGLATSGKRLYEADNHKEIWQQYCTNSGVLANRGEFRQAIREASKVLFLGQTSNNTVAMAFASADLAYAYSLAGDIDRAEEWANQALAHVARSQLGRDRGAILASIHKIVGDIAMRRDNIDLAIKYYQSALSQLFRADPRQLSIKISIANAEIRRGKIDVARQILDEIGTGDDGWAPFVLRARGQLAFAERNFVKAAEHFSAAANTMRGGKNTYHLMWMQHGLGQALAAAGDPEKALTALRDAIITARSIRTTFRSSEFRAGFFGDVQSIYDDAIGLLVDAKRFDEALVLSEESRARAFLDILKGSTAAEDTNTADAIAQIPANTTVLVYHVLHARTIAWAVRNNGTTAAVIPAGVKELAVVVGRYRRALLARTADAASQSQKLYELLAAPLSLKPDEALIVVPHRALHYLPFQALRGPQGYLIEERSVSTMPSLNAMYAIVSKAVFSTAALIAVGNPTLDEPGLALPGAEREVKAIGGLYLNAKVFVRDEASKRRFVADAPGNGLIHIAAHASVDELDPLYSSIRLAKAGQLRGELEAHEILKLDLSQARLVTLSACESGLGKVSNGDEFYGFKRTFLAAGAKALLVSLWPIEDESTANLMGVFYKELQGRPMAEALRQAQLTLIKSGTYADPAFWAPFMLVGDWR